MKSVTALAITFGLALGLSAANATEATPTHHHHYKHHQGTQAVEHHAPVAAPVSIEPSASPSHPGEGRSDGLSRDPDDCNKGCIGGNPG
jgi:hypothetical protein